MQCFDPPIFEYQRKFCTTKQLTAKSFSGINYRVRNTNIVLGLKNT